MTGRPQHPALFVRWPEERCRRTDHRHHTTERQIQVALKILF